VIAVGFGWYRDVWLNGGGGEFFSALLIRFWKTWGDLRQFGLHDRQTGRRSQWRLALWWLGPARPAPPERWLPRPWGHK